MDIFSHRNKINLSIQGLEVTIIDATGKLQLSCLAADRGGNTEAMVLTKIQPAGQVLFQDGVQIQHSVNFFEKMNQKRPRNSSQVLQILSLS